MAHYCNWMSRRSNMSRPHPSGHSATAAAYEKAAESQFRLPTRVNSPLSTVECRSATATQHAKLFTIQRVLSESSRGELNRTESTATASEVSSGGECPGLADWFAGLTGCDRVRSMRAVRGWGSRVSAQRLRCRQRWFRCCRHSTRDAHAEPEM